MKRWMMLGVIAVLVCGLWAFAEETKPDKTKIEALIKQLGAENFETREKAQQQLIEIGEKMVEEYRKVKGEDKAKAKSKIEGFAKVLNGVMQTKDAEIKMRANKIRLYFYSFTQPKIVFVSNRDGNENTYVMDADGKNQKKLTEKASNEYDILIPDGTKNLFTSMETKDQIPTLSPDGTKIVFVSYWDGNYEIYIMDSDGERRKRLTENKKQDYSPHWSPDGTKIAFISEKGGNSELYVMDTDGKNQQKLAEGAMCSEVTWSHDGSKIVFSITGVCEIKMGMYIVDLGSKKQNLLTEKDGITSPRWSPDGSQILFESWSDGDKRSEIYIIDADGKNQKSLTQNREKSGFPRWSPDGTKIVFHSWQVKREGPRPLGDYDVYIMDADGKNQKNLTENPAYDGRPFWHPLSFPELSVLFATEEEKK